MASSNAPTRKCRIGVVGAGVCGLSTAVVLAESLSTGAACDADVTIVADRFTPNTCSDGAAGLWRPFFVKGTPQDKLDRWAKVTFDWLYLQTRLATAPDRGVFICPCYDCHSYEVEDPSWGRFVRGFRHLTTEEQLEISPEAKTGWFYSSVIVEGSRYLPWLMKRFTDLRGKIVQRTINNLHELEDEFDVVVNCSGMRARWLANDTEMDPVRGQIIKVRAPWIKHTCTFDSPDFFTYVIPNIDVVVIGGTVQESDWNEELSAKDREGILQRTSAMIPSLKNAEIVGEWAGLRPRRHNGIRVEKEDVPVSGERILPVIHNYGHAGAGLTLHWGCAYDAAALVLQALQLDTICQLVPEEHIAREKL